MVGSVWVGKYVFLEETEGNDKNTEFTQWIFRNTSWLWRQVFFSA